jgi:hypothetical protein
MRMRQLVAADRPGSLLQRRQDLGSAATDFVLHLSIPAQGLRRGGWRISSGPTHGASSSILETPSKASESGSRREQRALEERYESLKRRLAVKQEEHVHQSLRAGALDEEEREVHMADLKNPVENLNLLVS